ncbi:MAG: hypothetical protein FJX72_12025 [Armatimonadetes bacterium]|nr:hypothetical protein [Armatimonadota bacterium]
MKTTIELPDMLLRQAKAEAALRGRRLKDLVEDGLRLVLIQSDPEAECRVIRERLLSYSGIVASGVTDLSTNPSHLERMGAD